MTTASNKQATDHLQPGCRKAGYGIEIDCHYTDIIIRRFDEVYGLQAVHAESKLDFERLKTERFKEMVEKRKTVKGSAQKDR